LGQRASAIGGKKSIEKVPLSGTRRIEMNKDSKLVYSTGAMENKPFAGLDKLWQAQEEAAKENKAAREAAEKAAIEAAVEEHVAEPEKSAEQSMAPAKLTDLIKSVEVSKVEPTLDEETVAKIKAEIADTKEGAKIAGSKLFEIREINIPKIQTEIRKLENLSASGLSSIARESLAKKRAELAQQREDEKRLLNLGNEAYRERVEFSYNLQVVQKKVEPDIVQLEKKMADLCAKEYCRLATPEEVKKCRDERKWPEFTVFAGRDEIYFMGPQSKTEGQKRALSLTLRGKFETARLKKSAFLKERGNFDLGGFLPGGKPGKYVFCAEEYIDKRGKKHGGGVLLGEIYDRNRGSKKADKPYFIFQARDAEGSLSWAAPEEKWWVPFSWVKFYQEKGFIPLSKEKRAELEERLGEGYIKYAENLIRKVVALHSIWKRGLNPQIETEIGESKSEDSIETPAPTETPILSNGSPPMAAEFDRKIETETGEIPVFTKKAKKNKKAAEAA
jgi:hypothetical protein